MTNLVFIKHLGIAVPAWNLTDRPFTVHAEKRTEFRLVKPDNILSDILVERRAILRAGVTVTLPTEFIDNSDADTLNEKYEKQAIDVREAVQEEPKRGRRGRRAKVVEEPEEEEEEDIAVDNTAIFIPVIQHEFIIDSLPVVESKAMEAFNEANQEKIEAKLAQHTAIRNRLEDIRSKLRAPSISDVESSLGSLGEERIDAEGINRFENGLKAQATQMEERLRANVDWVEQMVVARANKKFPKVIAPFTKDLRMGDKEIKVEDILDAIRTELFGNVIAV